MTSTASMAEIPVYSHSLKLEDTSKGLRISCHVYANELGVAIEEAFNMYLQSKIKASENKIPLAPVDIK